MEAAMRKAVLFSASLIAVSVLATAPFPSQAQTMGQAICGLREDMGKMLLQRFGEEPKAAGAIGDDRVVELLISQTGSWTLLVTTPDGRSCVMTGGDDWTDDPVEATHLKIKEETT
jgi:hypothetical protein